MTLPAAPGSEAYTVARSRAEEASREMLEADWRDDLASAVCDGPLRDL